MKKFAVILVGLMLSTAACAKPQTLSWSWPTNDCDGDPLDQAQWVSAEIIYDTSPMPMPSDSAGTCTGTDPDGPASSTSVPITSPDTSIVLNLQPGVPYYARIRVCYVDSTNCSNWSAQANFTVPYGKPGPAIWLN